MTSRGEQREAGGIGSAFAGEVAIVTGAGAGIGRAIAAKLARDGAAVLVNDLHADQASRVASEIRDGGGRCEAMAGDASDLDTVRTLAVELASRAIRVNAVAPGHTLVPRNVAEDPDYAARWAALTPSGRVATPEDIANAVAFLLSRAGEQMRGQTLLVDGGWSIRGSM